MVQYKRNWNGKDEPTLTHTERFKKGRVKRRLCVLGASRDLGAPGGLISTGRVVYLLMAGIITLAAPAVCRSFCHRFIITLIAQHLAVKQSSLLRPQINPRDARGNPGSKSAARAGRGRAKPFGGIGTRGLFIKGCLSICMRLAFLLQPLINSQESSFGGLK